MCRFVDELQDGGAGQSGAEADVVQPAVGTQCDAAAGVDAVGAKPVVGGDDRAGGNGFRAGGGLGGGVPAQRSVRPDGVVVAGEAVQLGLQSGDAGRRWLGGQPLLQGLVEAFRLAAGLRMVRAGVAPKTLCHSPPSVAHPFSPTM